MTYRIESADGRVMAAGKTFGDLEAAIEAGKTVIRRSLSNRRAHGTAAVDVVEMIPGRYTTRAIVNPDLTVTRKGA